MPTKLFLSELVYAKTEKWYTKKLKLLGTYR